MVLTEKQVDEMLDAARPLMKWLSENCHPHCTALVDNVRVELAEVIAANTTGEFLKD